ncbi:uncharacterized protein F4822DRAFT_417848 [Hypoxylon trugodes]|uniref:uncharacterized protein n=1 Tax=Hypoxylon trugodes TaxID=326681 RepID=UPI00219D35BD|nr:uncharacterized protein F4822DRAFT_417848 [Hypoxylon trugodes]KAI1383859.1 hypothetical protein F4822DRAFT_417848 [Hypoxylon trugodes]
MGSKMDGDEEVLYFAYGSNLSSTQMQERCPWSSPIGLGYLPGWTWLINERGYANVVQQDPEPHLPPPTPTSLVSLSPLTLPEGAQTVENKETEGLYGVLFSLDPVDQAPLDMCEGVPWAYEKRNLDVTLLPKQNTKFATKLEPKTVRALVYIDFKRVTPGKPKDEYIDRINRGVEEATIKWNFPKSYVDVIIRPFIPEKRKET